MEYVHSYAQNSIVIRRDSVFFFQSVAVKSIECFEKLLIWLHFVTYGRFILTIQVWVIIRCLVSTLRHDDLGAVLI